MEADVLRWSLLVIGTVVIIGLAVHGIWVSRKNNDKKITKANKRSDQDQIASDKQFTDEDVFKENRDFELHDNEPVFNSLIDPVVDETPMDFDTD